MRSPLAGFVCTLLIFVPLVAVPCLAIFGVPRTAQSSAVSPTEDLKFAADHDSQNTPQNGDLLAPVKFSDSNANNQGSTNSANSAQRERDPFAEFNRSPDDADVQSASTKSAARSKQLSDRSRSAQAEPGPVDEGNAIPQKSLVALGTANRRPKPDDVVAERNGEDPSVDIAAERTRSKGRAMTTGGHQALDDVPAPVSRTGHRPEALNWRSAVAWLNKLGIHDFQLQPGESEGEFHFSCRFVSPINPRVMMRFEAEAADPLEAVGKVLRQVDDWKRQNATRASTWLKRPSQSMLTARGASNDAAPAADATDR
jgi:hypothetical protein